MAPGKIPGILLFLGSAWSLFLKLARPILLFTSSKFREREQEIPSRKNENSRLSIWIHASSLGEFEQARPIIEALKKQNVKYDVTVTFFSPSGYRIRKSYEYADRVLYLPLDTKANAYAFLESINPDLIIFIRYELWLNYLIEARKRAIPFYAVNTTFPRSAMWKFIPSILRSILGLFSEIYTVGKAEVESFRQLNIPIPIHSGNDTRIDRIHSLVSEMKQSPNIIQKFLPGLFDSSIPCIVIGSSWEEDERIFIEALKFMQTPIRLIIVPHEPTHEHCVRLKESLPNSILQSEMESIEDQHIIIDSIGKLLAIYSIKNSQDALAWMNAICAGAMQKAGEQSLEYIESRRGMTDIILRDIIGID